VTVREVGPSRVMVVTHPFTGEAGAEMAAWTMMRLSGPEQLHAQLHRYQYSVGSALGGLIIALGLMWSLSRSLTRQRDAEARLRDDLRRTEQLASLGRMLAGVAHEIRNPLAAIRSTIQLWQRKPDSATMEGTMGTILHETERLNGLLTRLLQFARSDHAERHRVDTNQLMNEILKFVETQAASQGVTTSLDLAPGLPVVRGSSAALRQVFLNLMTNALQAMPQGGQLVCRIRAVAHPRGIEITVSDTGPGVAPKDRPHLFEPFFTTRADGTGLGLALCREIVVQHGGTVRLQPESARGATFIVTLPIPEG